MSILYKKLIENEIETFIDMRINQLKEEGAKEDIDVCLHLMIIVDKE